MFNIMLRIVVICAVMSISTQLLAGVIDVIAADSKTKEPAYGKEISVSQLRCWQYGRLIFEENGWSAPALGDKKKTIVFSGNNKKNTQLYLIDFGESTCLFRKAR